MPRHTHQTACRPAQPAVPLFSRRIAALPVPVLTSPYRLYGSFRASLAPCTASECVCLGKDTGSIYCGKTMDNVRTACRRLVIKAVQSTEAFWTESESVCKKLSETTFKTQTLTSVFHTNILQFQSVIYDFSAFSPAPTITTTKLNKSRIINKGGN